MGNEKIIFLDVDGTLVGYDNQLPKSAVEAIHQAQARGHKVYMCTGRSEGEIQEDIAAIGMDGMIGGNGAYVRTGDQIILHQKYTVEQVKRAVNWLHERGLAFYLECNSGLYASEDFETEALDAVRAYAGSKGAKIQKVRDAFPFMIYDATDFYRDDVNKISFVLKSYQDHLDSIEAFPDLKAGTWGGVGETALFGDLGIKGIDKGHAVDVLLEYLGVSLQDTYAFGDAKVDIPMLEKCAVGVAMGNGGPEIKAMADYITDSVDADGIYHAFAHFGLIS